MFFYVSKILWFLAQPSNLLMVIVALSVLALYGRWAHLGRRFLVGSTLVLLFFGIGPGGSWPLIPLENRFPTLAADFPEPTGIVVLGGGVNEVVSSARNTGELSYAGPRITASAALTRRYPNARLVFTGGSGSLFRGDVSEAEVAQRIYVGLGIPAERLTLEQQSRNTWENAVMTRDLVKPKPGEVWLLVTSAFHMPRAMGIFRKAGFEVVPCPVDYGTRGWWRDYVRPTLDMSQGLRRFDAGVREWIGLVAYYFSGKTTALFPSP